MRVKAYTGGHPQADRESERREWQRNRADAVALGIEADGECRGVARAIRVGFTRSIAPLFPLDM